MANLYERTIKNIKNIGEQGMVSLEWQNFLKENKVEIEKFLNNYSKDISTKIEYVHSIHDILKQKIEEDTQIKANISQMGLYRAKNSESFKGYFSIYIDIKKGEETIVLEPHVSRQNPSCLRLELWNRETNKKDWSKEIELLKSDFPNIEQIVDGSWKNCLFLEEIDFANNIPLEEIVNKLFGIINKLI
jgi:transposase